MEWVAVEAINYNGTDADPFPVIFTCPTSTCQSQRYSSLSACYECVDVTDKLSQFCANDGIVPARCNYTLPDGRSLNLGADYSNSTFVGGTTVSNQTTMLWNPATISQLSFIGSRDGSDIITATECMIEV